MKRSGLDDLAENVYNCSPHKFPREVIELDVIHRKYSSTSEAPKFPSPADMASPIPGDVLPNGHSEPVCEEMTVSSIEEQQSVPELSPYSPESRESDLCVVFDEVIEPSLLEEQNSMPQERPLSPVPSDEHTLLTDEEICMTEPDDHQATTYTINPFAVSEEDPLLTPDDLVSRSIDDLSSISPSVSSISPDDFTNITHDDPTSPIHEIKSPRSYSPELKSPRSYSPEQKSPRSYSPELKSPTFDDIISNQMPTQSDEVSDFTADSIIISVDAEDVHSEQKSGHTIENNVETMVAVDFKTEKHTMPTDEEITITSVNPPLCPSISPNQNEVLTGVENKCDSETNNFEACDNDADSTDLKLEEDASNELSGVEEPSNDNEIDADFKKSSSSREGSPVLVEHNVIVDEVNQFNCEMYVTTSVTQPTTGQIFEIPSQEPCGGGPSVHSEVAISEQETPTIDDQESPEMLKDYIDNINSGTPVNEPDTIFEANSDLIESNLPDTDSAENNDPCSQWTAVTPPIIVVESNAESVILGEESMVKIDLVVDDSLEEEKYTHVIEETSKCEVSVKGHVIEFDSLNEADVTPIIGDTNECELSVEDPIVDLGSLKEADDTPVIEDTTACELSVKDPVIEFDSLHEANDAPVTEDTNECELSVKDPVIEFDSLHEANVTPVIEDPSECEISVKDPVIEFDSLHEANDAPVIEDTTACELSVKDPVIEFDSLHEANDAPVTEDTNECELSVKDPVIEFDSLHEANVTPVIEDKQCEISVKDPVIECEAIR